MPVDFVLSKFTRLAPRLRSVSHILAPLTAGLAATTVQQSALPTPLVAAGAALLAWVLNTTVTANAARVSRSPEYAGLGHIPVLMSAAVGGACIVPLGLALPGLGYGAAAVALMLLGLAELGGRTGQPLQAGGPARSVAPRQHPPAGPPGRHPPRPGADGVYRRRAPPPSRPPCGAWGEPAGGPTPEPTPGPSETLRYPQPPPILPH